ncbi:butyrophilin subfamily 1 member A1-like [Ictidomys tridecemlineatus]
MDAQHMEVSWFHGNHSGLVHYYRDSKDYLEQQRPVYHGRMELLRENITRGQVALRIHSICPADEGDYRCLFVSSTYHSEARFHVEVTGGLMRNQPPPSEGIEPTELLKPGQVGPAHLLYQTGGSPDDAPLPCLSQVRASATELSTQAQRAGWYPEPEVHWEDSLEQHMTPASETKTTDGDGLFGVQTSIMVDKSLSAKVSCFIRNPVLSSQKGVCVSLAEEIEQEKAALLEKFGLNKIRKFAEDIILDKDTAHLYLAVSPDGKCVKSVTKKQDVPDKPERFDTMPAVLGWNRFSSGSHYWEVEVAGNSKWTVGVCVESVNHKGQYISAKTQSGFWTLCLKDGTYKGLSVSHHVFQVTGPLLRVGIFFAV